ncbi:MAG: hypothetical protein ABIL11_17355 [Chloroflexota bacterium]
MPVYQTMPRDITAGVMALLQKDVRPAFVTWNDFVLSLVIALCVGALWFAVQNLHPLLLAQIRMQGILFYQDVLVNARWLIPAILFGFAAFLSALTISYLQNQLSVK